MKTRLLAFCAATVFFAGMSALSARHAFTPGESTGLRGPYLGQQPPGTTPQIFAPGIVSIPDAGDYSPTFSPDGKEIYFTRSSRALASQRIMVSRLEAEGWTVPEPASFAVGFSGHEPHVSLDNRRLFWGWFRPVPEGEPNPRRMNYGIWACDRTAAGWSAPTFVGQGMFVTTDRAGRLYVSDHTEPELSYLATARMVNGKFNGFDRLRDGLERLRAKGVTNIAHPGIAPDGSYILFDIDGGFHLCVSFRKADNTWSDPVDLTEHNIDPDAGIASVSPDGKYVFFGLNGDIYWVSAKMVEDLRHAPAVVAPKLAAAGVVRTTIEREGVAAARLKIDDIYAHRDRFRIDERDINSFGYLYLNSGAFEKAIAMFEFNLRCFPQSDNVYDSLAEASIKADDMPRLESTLQAWLKKAAGDPAIGAKVAEFRALAAQRASKRFR